MTKVVNWITGALDGSQRAVGVLCDLFWASDCVDHKTLIEKLNSIGMRDKEQLRIYSFLKDQFGRTKIAEYKITNQCRPTCFRHMLNVKCPRGQLKVILNFLFILFQYADAVCCYSMYRFQY